MSMNVFLAPAFQVCILEFTFSEFFSFSVGCLDIKLDISDWKKKLNNNIECS